MKKSKVKSTEALQSDGITCSSVEGPVMGLEQRCAWRIQKFRQRLELKISLCSGIAMNSCRA